jgi:hypothetical protein
VISRSPSQDADQAVPSLFDAETAVAVCTSPAAATRMLAYRERAHPCAPITLFGADDGWRYSLRVTSRPSPSIPMKDQGSRPSRAMLKRDRGGILWTINRTVH